MRFLSLALALSAAMLIGGCGDKADDTTTGGGSGSGGGAGIALAGGDWDGGNGLDPTKTSDKVRVIQFFKPG